MLEDSGNTENMQIGCLIFYNAKHTRGKKIIKNLLIAKTKSLGRVRRMLQKLPVLFETYASSTEAFKKIVKSKKERYTTVSNLVGFTLQFPQLGYSICLQESITAYSLSTLSAVPPLLSKTNIEIAPNHPYNVFRTRLL